MLFDEKWIRKIRTEQCVRQERESSRYKRGEERILVELTDAVCRPSTSFRSPFPHPGGEINRDMPALSRPRDTHDSTALPCHA
jgi:hypothetical protein